MSKNNTINKINSMINELFELSDNFIYPEYYSHENKVMWKIKNQFTLYKEEILVLCPFDDNIEDALYIAIRAITKRKKEYLKIKDQQYNNKIDLNYTINQSKET